MLSTTVILAVATSLLLGCGSSDNAQKTDRTTANVQVLGKEIDQDGPITSPSMTSENPNEAQNVPRNPQGEDLCARIELDQVKRIVSRDDVTAVPATSANGDVCRFASDKTEVGFDIGFEANFVEYQSTFGVSKNFVSTSELQYVTASGVDDRIVSLAVRANDLDGVLVYRQATLAKVWLDRTAVVSILS